MESLYKDYFYIFYCFIIYSFMGWCLEVIYILYTEKRFVNKGFLYGPLCPIYGVTAVILIIVSYFVKDNLFYLFLEGFIIGSLVELITGYILAKLFHMKWWDYSNELVNIKGYVCLKFSVMWGALTIIFIKIIHPPVNLFVTFILNMKSEVIYNIVLIALVSDIAITINSLIQFRRFLIELYNIKNEIKENLERLKDKAISKAREIKLEDRNIYLKLIYEKLSVSITFKHKILLRAYPDITSKRFGRIIEEIKSKIKNSSAKLK
jgi:uncharacterized membrane protein